MSATFEHGRAYVEGSFRCALARLGPKWAHVCYIDDGNMLRVAKVPLREWRRADLPGYPTPERLAAAFLRRRKVGAMSKAARALCRETLDG